MTDIASKPAPYADREAAKPAVHRACWRVDVSETVPLEGVFEIAVDVALPTRLAAGRGDPERPTVVLCCLPGGFLSRGYFDLDHGEGEGEGGYSFTEAMANEGLVTLAFDHLGTGGSSQPDPIEGGYSLGVEAIAAANQRALELALERLAAGDASQGIPAIDRVVTIGVGHSMGSALTVEQQALARSHRALVLFSFTTQGVPAFLDPVQREYLGDPERARREIGELARRSMGSPYPVRAHNSEADRRAAFGVGTAPASAADALHRASTSLLAVGGLLSMIPGGYAGPAERIDVPVFVLIGDHDLHDDRGIRDMLPRAPEVETFVLADCWHCHFVANTRETLWKRVAEWIHARTPGFSKVPA